jgi:hypothetical protein
MFVDHGWMRLDSSEAIFRLINRQSPVARKGCMRSHISGHWVDVCDESMWHDHKEYGDTSHGSTS